MKKIIAVLVLAFAATGASAQGMSCALMGEFGERVMLARQSGVVMSRLMESVEAEARKISDREAVVGFFKRVIIIAYKEDKVARSQVKDTARVFRESLEVVCYEGQM